MTFGSKNTPWVPVEHFGAYYRLEEGVLMSQPMMVDGSKSIRDDVVEVAFDCISEEEVEDCKKIGEWLQTFPF